MIRENKGLRHEGAGPENEIRPRETSEDIKKQLQKLWAKGEIDEEDWDRIKWMFDAPPEERTRRRELIFAEGLIDEEINDRLKTADEARPSPGKEVPPATRKMAEDMVAAVSKGGVPDLTPSEMEGVLSAYGFSKTEIETGDPLILMRKLSDRLEEGVPGNTAEPVAPRVTSEEARKPTGEDRPTGSPGASDDPELIGLSRRAVEVEQAAERERIAREAADTLVGRPEDARAVVEGAAPTDMPLREREEIVQEIQSESGRRNLAGKISDYLKSREFWVGLGVGGVGGAARTGVKAAIVAGFGGTFGAGIAAGAVVGSMAGAVGGALAGGVRELIKERGGIRRKFAVENVLEKLREVPHQADTYQLRRRAAILAKAEAAYKDARIAGKEEDIKILGEELRAMRVLVEAEAQEVGEIGMVGSRDQVLAILESSDKARAGISLVPPEFTRETLKEVNFEYKKVDRAKVAKAILRGAAVGAVGGAIGGALADYFSTYFHHGAEQVAAAKTQAASQAAAAARAAANQEVLARKTETAGAATKRVLAKAQAEILEQKFGAVVEKGEGATHVARKIAHDYLVNERQLNPSAFGEFSPEQMVYVEDTLQKTVAKAAAKGFHAGDHFELSGEDVSKAVGKALNLTPEKISHLGELIKEPGHQLSSETVERITHFDQVLNADNNFSDNAIHEAKEAAAEAVSRVNAALAAEAQAQVAEETRREAAEKAARHGDRILKAILAASIAAAGALIARRIYKIRKGRVAEEAEEAGPVPAAGLKEAERGEKRESSILKALRRSKGGGKEAPATPEAAVTVPWETPRAPGGEKVVIEAIEAGKVPADFGDLRRMYGVDITSSLFLKFDEMPAQEKKLLVEKLHKVVKSVGAEKLRYPLSITLDLENPSWVSERGGRIYLRHTDSAEDMIAFLRANAESALLLANAEEEASKELSRLFAEYRARGIQISKTMFPTCGSVLREADKIKRAIDGIGAAAFSGIHLYLDDSRMDYDAAQKVLYININQSEVEIKKFIEESLGVSAQSVPVSGAEAPPSSVAGEVHVDVARPAEAATAAPEKPKSAEQIFNKLVDPYRKKGIILSTARDSERAAVINRFPQISKVIEEIGPEKLNGTAINFFQPAYGESARMSVGTRKKEVRENGRRMEKFVRVFNITVDASPESMKRFIEDNLGK